MMTTAVALFVVVVHWMTVARLDLTATDFHTEMVQLRKVSL